ncbi:angiotensin-converting enzyme-like [Episyrphus balteatus]|uniref:angiotensin-converting enzyme-like n=1 Tax=Episyrphus balteatus TaxID=286459 RepID=UPI002486BAE1|nr:angiotensin-converting enzyme-like [Episyrphus balteatus]
MAAIKPLYIELHAFIRNQLQKKYGDSIIKPDGLIPDHLFEQVLAQAWSNNSVIEDVFPLKNLPPVESVMKKRFKAINLYEIAERFYEHLGFEKYPYKIIKPHDDNDDECEAKVFYSTPDIRLEFCEKMNFMDFLQAYAQMGNIYYAQQMTGLPAYFFETKGLEDAIGNAVILSTSTHHNLKAIGMILDFNFTTEVEINRILRKAIQKVLNLPLDFVHIKVMADLMSEKVKIKELNKHYWELMDKYAGIGPPNDGGSNTLDLPYNFFMDMNENEMSRKFNMEIVSYQIYKRLCELSGKYPKEDLHLCDMHGSKDAGDALKKMMKLGSSKPMNEVLATMFPDNPKVMADSLLEYYNPLKVMIGEINKEANVKLGLKTSEIN